MLRRYYRLIIAFCAVAAVGMIGYDLKLALPQDGFLFDFAGFEVSARAAARGMNPYGIYPELPTYFWNGQVSYGINLNPPLTVLAFAPLTQFDPSITYRLWYALSLVVFLAVLVVLARAYPERDWRTRLPWALSIWGLWNGLLLGQLYTLLAALAVGAWLLQRQNRPILGGVLIGILVAIKPNFAIWPLLLFFAGQRRTAVAACVSVAALSALPLAAYGPEIYAQWLSVIGTNSLLTYPANGSLFAAAARLGLPRVAPFVSLAFIVALVAFIARTRPSAMQVSALGLVASLLASPIAWAGYALVLTPLFFSRSWSLPLIAVAVLWMIPEYLVVNSFSEAGWRFWLFGFAYLAGLLALLAVTGLDVIRMRSVRRPRARPATVTLEPAV
jgi:hypothetical protein